MKRIAMLLICLTMLFAPGCRAAGETPSAPPAGLSTTEQTTPPTATEPLGTPAATEPDHDAPLCAIALPLIEEPVQAADGTELFRFTGQNVLLTVQEPEIAERVTLDLMNRIDTGRTAAEALAAAAERAYQPDSDAWTPYFLQVLYSPQRIDRGVLSLYGELVSYDGAPHPGHQSLSVTYDLTTGRALAFSDVLDAEFSAEQLCRLAAEALEAQKDSLYPDFADALEASLADTAHIENWYLTEHGLCLYFSPYEIAPYAAGTVFAEIPYEKLGGMLKDAYFPDERTGTGAVVTQPFTDGDSARFSQFAEVTLARDGMRQLLTTDGTVYGVRLEQALGGEEYATVFAMEKLTPHMAVLVQANDWNLRVSYQSGESSAQLWLGEAHTDN